MTKTETIVVIAWVTNTGMRKTGRTVRFDGVNTRAEFEPCQEAHAAVWLNRATEADRLRAVVHAEAQHSNGEVWRVYSYPTTERDPLGRARREVMAEPTQESA